MFGLDQCVVVDPNHYIWKFKYLGRYVFKLQIDNETPHPKNWTEEIPILLYFLFEFQVQHCHLHGNNCYQFDNLNFYFSKQSLFQIKMSVQNFTFQMSQLTSFASLTPQYIFSIRKYHDKHRKNLSKKSDEGRTDILCAKSFEETLKNLKQNPIELICSAEILKKVQKNIIHNPIKSHWRTSHISGQSFLQNKIGR